MKHASILGLILVVAVATPGACKKRLPHGGSDPVYLLRGLHAALPCEGCHGSGTPSKLPTACIDCHVADRPDPTHNPGQDCARCHTEDGWDVGVYGTGDTGPTTPTVFDHAALPPEQLCWDCHEAERKDLLHYNDEADRLNSWDCGPCHGVVSWAEDSTGHPARTPHGTYLQGVATAPENWVVACVTCHPVSLDVADCSNCHLAIFPHYGDAQDPGPTADGSCIACHADADL